MTTAEGMKCLAPWASNPSRLISLGEIMEQFDPVYVMSITQILTNLLERFKEIPDDNVLSDATRLSGKDVLPPLKDFCSNMGLDASESTVDRTLALFDNPLATVRDLRRESADLRLRLKDQLDKRLFLYVGEAKHYNEWRFGWELVIARFKAAEGDIEEANKCFALGRYPAAVFHCMQIIEAALVVIGSFLIIPSGNKPSWGAITARLGLIFQNPLPKEVKLTQFEQDNFENLRQIYALAHILQSAWRNKISHAGERLVLMSADSTPEIAKEIMTATLSFTRRLATDLPDN